MAGRAERGSEGGGTGEVGVAGEGEGVVVVGGCVDRVGGGRGEGGESPHYHSRAYLSVRTGTPLFVCCGNATTRPRPYG